jgi:hypothetical protein
MAFFVCHWHICQDPPSGDSMYCEHHLRLHEGKERETCVACGGSHGSVNIGRMCLEKEIRRLRARLGVQ